MAKGYDTVTGWNAVTYPVELADMQASYAGETTAFVDVENGPPADILRTMAAEFVDLWDDQQGAYEASFINGAPGTNGVPGGAALENLLVDKIGAKVLAAASSVVLPFFADAGPNINIPAGTAVRLGTELKLWTLDAPIVIPGGGSINGTCSYSEDGPKTAIAASPWGIVNAITGWASVGPNVLDATPGRLTETDAQYRDRYRASLGDSTLSAIGELTGVTSVSLNEWPWGFADPVFGSTHWVEYLVVGGVNAEIAAAIHLTRAKGVNTMGNTAVAVADADYVGGFYNESFSRIALVPVHVEVTIVKGQDYPTDVSTDAVTARDNAIKAAVDAHFDTLAGGQSTSSFKVGCYTKDNAGIAGMDDVQVLLGLADPPLTDGTLTPDTREQFTVALADIDVIGA